MKENTEKLTNLLQTSILFAARYAHGRNTGASHVVIATINEIWEQLDEKTQQQILDESHEAAYNLDEWENFRKNKTKTTTNQ